jgi:1,4-alpha-glucan branching enzyme
VLNMTPVVRHDVPIYTDGKKVWREIFNSDDKEFYGTGDTYNPQVPVELVDEEKDLYKLTLQLPPLGAVIFK